MATSLIIGEATKKENVTPNGTPASIKPKNSGIAEQVQKGVTIPKHAATILPIYFFSWLRIALVLAGGKKDLMNETIKIMLTNNKNILIIS